jgi:hypothetical protein
MGRGSKGGNNMKKKRKIKLLMALGLGRNKETAFAKGHAVTIGNMSSKEYGRAVYRVWCRKK